MKIKVTIWSKLKKPKMIPTIGYQWYHKIHKEIEITQEDIETMAVENYVTQQCTLNKREYYAIIDEVKL